MQSTLLLQVRSEAPKLFLGDKDMKVLRDLRTATHVLVPAGVGGEGDRCLWLVEPGERRGEG